MIQYSNVGALIVADIILVTYGYAVSNLQILGLYAIILIIAGVVNSFAETALTALCYISVAWQTLGVLVIVIWMVVCTPKLQSMSFVLFTGKHEKKVQAIVI